MSEIPKWAEVLTRKRLDEADMDAPFWRIMAQALVDERSRCAGLVRDCVPSYHIVAPRLEALAKDIEEGRIHASTFYSEDYGG